MYLMNINVLKIKKLHKKITFVLGKGFYEKVDKNLTNIRSEQLKVSR